MQRLRPSSTQKKFPPNQDWDAGDGSCGRGLGRRRTRRSTAWQDGPQGAFRRAAYDEAVAGLNGVLKGQPDNGRAELLLSQCGCARRLPAGCRIAAAGVGPVAGPMSGVRWRNGFGNSYPQQPPLRAGASCPGGPRAPACGPHGGPAAIGLPIGWVFGLRGAGRRAAQSGSADRPARCLRGSCWSGSWCRRTARQPAGKPCREFSTSPPSCPARHSCSSFNCWPDVQIRVRVRAGVRVRVEC